MMDSSSDRYDIGFLGGGQLARMSIQAAQRMGLNCLSLDSGLVTPASQIAPAIAAELDDVDAIAEMARRCDRLTLENEFIPATAIERGLEIAGRESDAILPSLAGLRTIQDKLIQREAYRSCGVPSPKAVALEGDLTPIESAIGYPMVIKSRFGGYDGKGTRYARSRAELEALSYLWGSGGWLAEEFVPFKRELAAMVYLSPQGEGAFPTVETIQTDHICDLVFPAEVDASAVALSAAKAVGGYGLFGVELFELADGEVLVNEIAPRPHNSGHYTLDWGGVSQFEQHVRVVMGLQPATPMGSPVCMANLLGQDGAKDFRCGVRAALEDPGVHVHWYGKAESRPGRKMGHLNVLGANAVERAEAARERFYSAWRA
jgi:5-(carboxyamino)imidazole ribonucleotide synthase